MGVAVSSDDRPYGPAGHDRGSDGDAGFAELVADIALSFLAKPVGGAGPTLVQQIVAGAVAVIPGTAAAAVETLDRGGHLWAPLTSGDEVARLVMQAQNETGQGPCLDAVRDQKQVVTGDLQLDPRWPVFAQRMVALGVRAMICTPMEAAGRQLGVLSLMSRTTQYLDEPDSATMATVFAAHAAVALTGAQRVQDVNAALTHRDVIGQAKGILMERFKVTPDVAFAMLVRTSSVTNVKLRQVCDQLCQTGTLRPGTAGQAAAGRRSPEV